MKKMNVKNFEFSQAHITSGTRIERANHFLEHLETLTDRLMTELFTFYLAMVEMGDSGTWP